MTETAAAGKAGAPRLLDDDTLVVFVSDCHIGGDDGRDIFESQDDLAALFDDLDRENGPVELVLAGDFFDFLRIANVPPGENRATLTVAKPEYARLFATLRRFAAGKRRRVTYLPGNHDAEVWWNADLRAELARQGLVHEFALFYVAAFAGDPARLIYCEHGNEFDPENAISDYSDRLDRPLGDHIVTDIIPRLPRGRETSALNLGQIDRVFPLGTIPEWIAGRLFYALVTQAVRWLLLPLLVAYVGYETIAFVVGQGVRAINSLFVHLAYDVLWLLAAFGVFFALAWRMANRAVRAARPQVVEAEIIRGRLERGERPPLGAAISGDIAIFVSGHTHAPELVEFAAPDGGHGFVVNSGCWLRQLQRLRAHFRVPPVFISRFVQTHVRVFRKDGVTAIELWEHPRPSPPRLRIVERLAVAGRLPAQPPADGPPRVIASASLAPAPAARRVA
jgi:UDP-2,3-diacylglucosamine pyrophosphatase LpxH